MDNKEKFLILKNYCYIWEKSVKLLKKKLMEYKLSLPEIERVHA